VLILLQSKLCLNGHCQKEGDQLQNLKNQTSIKLMIPDQASESKQFHKRKQQGTAISELLVDQQSLKWDLSRTLLQER